MYQLVIRLPCMRIVRHPASRQQLIVPVLLLQPRVRLPYVVFLECGYVLSRTVVVAAFPFCQLLLHHRLYALFYLRYVKYVCLSLETRGVALAFCGEEEGQVVNADD